MRTVVYLFTLLFLTSTAKAQNNDRQAAVYNIATNSIAGGIGAVLNKKPEEKFHKVLLKGMGQGALGGYVIFESKRLVRNLSRTKDYAYVWPSKLLNTAGNSIVYNAASNRNFWERWHLDFGFNYLEYDFKRDRKLRYRILPFALYGTVRGFVSGSIDVKRTLYTGHFIFNLPKPNSEYLGYAVANNISYHPDYLEDTNGIITHEIIHSYQYGGYFFINAFLDKPFKKWEENNNIKNYNKIFLADFNYLFMQGIIASQDILGIEYTSQLQEKEASYYEDKYYYRRN